MGTDWRDNDPEVEPIVEIYQGDRMSYEMEEAPRAGYDPKSGKKPANIAGWYPKGYINLALRQGLQARLPVVERSLVHAHFLLRRRWPRSTTAQGILAALKKRHCYGATDNIIVDVRSGDHLMGDEFKTKDAPKLQLHVVGTAPMPGIDVLRDSEVVEVLRPEKPGESEYKGEWTDPKPGSGRALLLHPRAAEGWPTGVGVADVDRLREMSGICSAATILSQGCQCLLKFRRQRSLQLQRRSKARMTQTQPKGVQRLTTAGAIRPARSSRSGNKIRQVQTIAAAVDLVGQHRAADARQVNADLMRPSGARLNATKAEAAETFDHLVITHASLPSSSSSSVTVILMRSCGWWAMRPSM